MCVCIYAYIHVYVRFHIRVYIYPNTEHIQIIMTFRILHVLRLFVDPNAEKSKMIILVNDEIKDTCMVIY